MLKYNIFLYTKAHMENYILIISTYILMILHTYTYILMIIHTYDNKYMITYLCDTYDNKSLLR